MNNKNNSNVDMIVLKAQAYDTMAQIQALQQRLDQINNAITQTFETMKSEQQTATQQAPAEDPKPSEEPTTQEVKDVRKLKKVK